MPTDPSTASPTLRERLLAKIVMPGPATPCATWVGAYNVDGRLTGRVHRGRRPVIFLGGGRRGRIVYAAPTLLALVDDRRLVVAAAEACHRGCPTGEPVDGVYRCVDLAHLAWGSRQENEDDKRRDQ